MPPFRGPEKGSIPYTSRLIRVLTYLGVTEPNDILRNHSTLAETDLKYGPVTLEHFFHFNRPEADVCLIKVDKVAKQKVIFLFGQGQGVAMPAEWTSRTRTARAVRQLSPGSVVLYSLQDNPRFWNWRLSFL